MTSRKSDRADWYRVDLHIHTPASADYQQPTVTYLDILQRAELRGIDVLAFTDHNTVAGYATLQRIVEQLEFLAARGQATPDEQRTLAEYRRLLNKILVLPGFEFTATFGFHVLGIFHPRTPIRRLEHVLLNLRLPYEAIESGLTEVGASADVLTAYRAIREAGGICIAAHVNAAHGVAMRNIDFGGQTRIAYTQDHHLHALEVTDLAKRGRYATQSFFDGSKPEYPRRMRCIQGSDAHRLDSQSDRRGKVINFGVGERATELRLRDQSFESLQELFESSDFASSRPYIPGEKPEDDVQAARVQGVNLVQAFYDAPTQGGVLRYNVLADICAFANTHGGTLYLGMGTEMFRLPAGIEQPQMLIEQLTRAIDMMLSPSLGLVIDIPVTQGKQIVRVQVPRGPERPYALETSKIYIRTNGESILASRDQIIKLVLEAQDERGVRTVVPEVPSPIVPDAEELAPPPVIAEERPRPALPDRHRDHRRERRDREPRETPREVREPLREPPKAAPAPVPSTPPDELPRIGVEVVAVESRGSINVYTLRDLRTSSVTRNVTRNSASKLWRYVIKQQESNPVVLDQVRWNGDYGLWRKYRRLAEVRYDLVLRTKDGVRYFYGVPETELKGGWRSFASAETVSDDAPPGVPAPSVAAEAGKTESGDVVAQVQPGADGEVAPAKRKRRRRGGRHRKAGAAVTGEVVVDAPVVEDEPEAAQPAAIVEESVAPAAPEPAEVKSPATRRRRPARRKSADGQDKAVDAPAAEQAAPAAEAEVKPKATRKRTTGAKTKAADAEAETAKKPARTRAKRASAEAVEEPEKKPAATRKRRTTRKKADDAKTDGD
ncbi:MAG: putative DNA binding domain-containing protein [Anaerolineae bacterium]|nr:putative DNA binding domain-containing protein [Anaerolineae bacterium]